MPLETEAAPLERPKPRAAEQPWLGRHELQAAGFHDEADSGPAPLTEHAAQQPGPMAAARTPIPVF